MQTRRIAAIFTGHTHYAQVANDGRNIVVATRSIGDPEGGQPGYMLAFAHGDDLAITYRSIDETGPIVLVTHPREKLLASYARHIIVGPDELRVRTWCDAQMSRIAARVDDGEWHALLALEEGSWWYPLATDQLAKGEHQLDVQAVDAEGRRGGQTIHFMVDATGRYTAVPFVRPVVTGTAFC